MRHPQPLSVAAIAAAVAVTAFAWPARAQGTFTRGSEQRGDVTDTSPKVDTWTFVNDALDNPHELSLAADTWAARAAVAEGLLPIRLGVGYEGTGEPLPIAPQAFELSWEGGSSRGLALEELRKVPGWKTQLGHHQRVLANHHVPWNRNLVTGLDISFYPDPPSSVGWTEDARLPPGALFTDLVYFRLPEGVDPWTTLFTLAFRPCDAVEDAPPCDPAVTMKFRIDRDPALQQKAFRKARKASR